MTIIILAAGRGERLWPLTKNTPKPLLDLGNGNTLLEEQIERIKASGVIDRVVVVVGYLAEQIEAKMKVVRSSMPVEFLYNPFYDISNNLVSLWMARNELVNDVIITNGDNLFSPDVFEGLVRHNPQDGVYVTIVDKDEFSEEDMKVTLECDSVVDISKGIQRPNAHAESVGLIMLRGKRYSSLLMEHLEMLVREKQNLVVFWLEAFNSMHRKGVWLRPWKIAPSKWQEVDFHFDIANARALISNKLSLLAPSDNRDVPALTTISD